MGKMYWKTRSKIISVIFLLIFAFVFIFPFIWAIGISLLGEARYVYTPETYFKPPFNWKSYQVVFSEGGMLGYVKNTLVITIPCIVFTLISCSFIAYGFARFKPKGMEVLFVYMLSTMFLPAVVMTIPIYILWNTIGAIDTYLPFILPTLFGGAMNIFLIRQNYMGIPSALAEAAYIDGMNDFKIWFTIYVPLTKPILAFIAVQQFMSRWNDFMGPLIFITSPHKYTLMQGLRFLTEKYAIEQNVVMAATIISIIPVLIVYAVAQKQFVSGLASGAVKS